MIIKKLITATLVIGLMASLSVGACAADYSFKTDAPHDYYAATDYESVYGSRYNYDGENTVDYQLPELPYGVRDNGWSGLMERAPAYLSFVDVTSSGLWDGDVAVIDTNGLYISPTTRFQTVTYREPAFTSVDGMARSDGSIGTVSIPSIDLTRKVYEGETSSSMAKGVGHYAATSAWDGNVVLCGVRPDRA